MEENTSLHKADYLFIFFSTLALALVFHNPLTVLGFGFFLILFMQFFREMENRLPVELIIVLLAGLQWVVAPAISYKMGIDHYKYHMYIPETEYMALAVPAVLLLYLGIRLLQNKNNEKKVITELFRILPDRIHLNPYFPLGLVFIGLAFTYLFRQLPGPLQFVGYLLAGVKYIGLIYFIFLRWRNGVVIGILLLMLTIYTSIRAGMFHEFFLWIMFIGLYVSQVYKPSVLVKWVAVFLLILMLLVIQLVKMEYREILWTGKISTGYVTTYTELVMEKLENEELAGTSNIESTVIRLNQGWIVSRIISRVPSIVPFAGGETVRDAIRAAIAPRLVNPGKKTAGGKENYERFTGYTLTRTSMGISLLGEGYANFGKTGALVFIFLVGIFYSLMIRLVYRLTRSYPSLILWLPLLFLHTIKAETELIVVLNYLVKSFILVMLLLWGMNKVLGIKL